MKTNRVTEAYMSFWRSNQHENDDVCNASTYFAVRMRKRYITRWCNSMAVPDDLILLGCTYDFAEFHDQVFLL